MEKRIRKPYAAGTFYEADPEHLSSIIERMVASATTPGIDTGVRAVILPHAGYVYSGQTAATTLVYAAGGDYKRIMVIAPSHRYAFHGLAFSEYSAYSTPLGDCEIELDAVRKILSGPEKDILHNHSQVHDNEHALEVEVPLLLRFFKNAKLIPAIAGQVDITTARKLAEALADYWNPETLWVISSDFTHYGTSFQYVPFTHNVPENLRELDMEAVQCFLDINLEGFQHYLDKTGVTICGAAPIKILLAMLERAVKNGEKMEAKLAAYTTSGAMTGDFSHCVSYAGVVFRQK